jgi:hypothetical protein
MEKPSAALRVRVASPSKGSPVVGPVAQHTGWKISRLAELEPSTVLASDWVIWAIKASPARAAPWSRTTRWIVALALSVRPPGMTAAPSIEPSAGVCAWRLSSSSAEATPLAAKKTEFPGMPRSGASQPTAQSVGSFQMTHQSV